MKAHVDSAGNVRTWTLYPTWFRWKFPWLYCNRRSRWCFISHMVQMKGRSPVFSWTPHRSLYPTWFRWKEELNFEDPADFVLYIPHGSDESEKPHPVRRFEKPLYPTWFRWKITSVVDMRPLVGTLYPTWFRWKNKILTNLYNELELYIPHGSDESIIAHFYIYKK